MWASLKNTNDNTLVRMNLKTLEKAVDIATAINEKRADDATAQMIELTNALAAEKGEAFQQKIGLAQWSVRMAQDFLSGTLVTIEEDEAQVLATQAAMAELTGA
jgi:hypothetical protein